MGQESAIDARRHRLRFAMIRSQRCASALVFQIVVMMMTTVASPFEKCLVQLYSEQSLLNDRTVGAHGARVSLYLAQNFSRRHAYRHLLYDCATRMHCRKPSALADACWARGCRHVLYLDSDVFVTNDRIDPIDDIV